MRTAVSRTRIHDPYFLVQIGITDWRLLASFKYQPFPLLPDRHRISYSS